MTTATRIAAAALGLALGGGALAQADPLGSARWEDMKKAFFAGAQVEFDPRVRVAAPAVAENPLSVPVWVDASDLKGVAEVLVFADFNPIVKALAFQPARARPSLAFRLKLQQSTPVRAAARTADGVWHLGGTWVTTAGGGCTQPSTGSASPLWQQRLNEVSARRWQSRNGVGERLRFSIIHPMDTGLAAGIPAFHLEELRVTDAEDRELMRIEPFEPVAENPLFTIDLPAEDIPVRISGRDNNGNPVDAWVGR